MRSNLVAAIVLILVGLFLLASNLGWTNMNMGKLILTWWPVVLVAVGIGLLFGRGKESGPLVRCFWVTTPHAGPSHKKARSYPRFFRSGRSM